MKNKVICILLLFILISCTFVNNSYANISYQGKAFPEFPNEYDNFQYKIIAYQPNSGIYRLFLFNVNSYFTLHDLVIYGKVLEYRFIPKTSNNWVYYKSYNDNDDRNSLNNFFGWEGYEYSDEEKSADYWKQMIYSNVDIHFKDSEKIFFHKTPLLNFTNTQRWLGGIFWQILMRAVTILVPIGLTIFGAFCVIYLIASKKWLPIKHKGF